MKYSDTFTFKLESPDGDAVFTAKYLPLNLLHELRAAGRIEKNDENLGKLEEIERRYLAQVLGGIVSVEGLETLDGTPITAAEFNVLAVDSKLANMVCAAYLAAYAGKEAQEAPEKKDLSSE